MAQRKSYRRRRRKTKQSRRRKPSKDQQHWIRNQLAKRRAPEPRRPAGGPFTIPDGYAGISPTANIYDRRDRILNEMGFASYAAYLQSALWKEIRRDVRLWGMKCPICTGRKATQVHHIDYTPENLAGVDLHLLMPICRQCHETIEFRDDGTKRHPADVAVQTVWFRVCFSCERAAPRNTLQQGMCLNCAEDTDSKPQTETS